MNRSAVFVAEQQSFQNPQSQRLYLLENFAEMNRKVRAFNGKSKKSSKGVGLKLKLLFELFPFISHQVRKWQTR